MRVARVLQGTEGEDAESHRVQGHWGRGVATHRAGEQAGRRRRVTRTLLYLAKGCAKVTK